MQSAKKILFHLDATGIGGHEIVCLAACDSIRELFPSVEVTWLVSAENSRLLERLRNKGYQFSFLCTMPRDRLLKHPFAVASRVFRNSRKVRHLRPDVVVAADGIIPFSFLGSLTARLARVPHCSYLPNASLATDFGERPALLDVIWRLCVRRIPNFITTSDEQKGLITVNNPKAKIKIVENYVPRNRAASISRSEARQNWNIFDPRPVIGLVGRVAFAPKNHDWLARQLAADPFWRDYLIWIVGDGPDMPRLQKLVSELKLEKQVLMTGWSEKVETVYPALDLLLVPSRTENGPLVMLEALDCRVPVAGSNVGGMKEWLPEEWRFEAGDGEGMKRAVLAALRGGDEDYWTRTARHLDFVHDRRRFASEFLEAVLSFE